MPRKYDRVIRYYASWFDDFLSTDKEFTAEEFRAIILAIRDCQVNGSLEPLETLPITIRRALSMATMGEQILRILERAENMRARGSAGGRKAAAGAARQEQLAATSIREELREHENQAKEKQREEDRREAVKPSLYEEMLKLAAHGDEYALKELQLTEEQAKQIYAKKGGEL